MIFRTDFSSVLSQLTRLTDGQTERQTDWRTDTFLIASPRWHSMQRRKKWSSLCMSLTRPLSLGLHVGCMRLKAGTERAGVARLYV